MSEEADFTVATCHICGMEICGQCGCCCNPSCDNCSCPTITDKEKKEAKE
jgi:hypothetical protein